MRRRGTERSLTTVLFTDIVGSTERAAELGDRKWRALLGSHHQVVRKALRRNRGREVDTAGDGFFATFDNPAEAIRCASELVQLLRTYGIEIRAGVHMGEVEQMGPKVGGIAVHIGARVASKASAGEIIVSSTVRELVTGSDFRFADRGVEQLKGVPGEWRLFRVEDAGVRIDEPEEGLPQEPARRSRTPMVVAAAAVVVAVVVVVILLTRGGSSIVAAGPNTVVGLGVDGKLAGVAQVGSKPTGIAFGAGSLWVINDADRTLSRIDPKTLRVQQTRSVGGTPTGIAFGADAVWVATFGQTIGGEAAVLRFDPRTTDPPKSIRVSSGVGSITFGAGSVWVTNKNANALVRIDPLTSRVSKTIAVGNGPEGVTASSAGVWVANSLEKSVWRIDPATDRVTARIALSIEPNTLTSGAGSVWVLSATDNKLVRIDPGSNSVITTIAVGVRPSGVAVGAGGVWVGGLSDRSLWKVDPATNRARRVAILPSGLDALFADKARIYATLHEL